MDNIECNRSVSYSFQHMLYHMYFSSPGYIVPDVVVVYSNTEAMSINDEDASIHTEISYRNMTNTHTTVLVLTDKTEGLLKLGVRAVTDAQPVEQLVQPTIFRHGVATHQTCLRKQI